MEGFHFTSVHRPSGRLIALVLGATLAAWLVSYARMRGMDAGPGTDLGSFGWFIGIWLTMTVAMMLPSVAPVTLLYSRFATAPRTALFVVGYLLVWTVFGSAAYLLDRVAHAAAPSFLAWGDGGPWVAGAALTVAGLYQLTPLKTACLRHCRSPLSYLLRQRAGVAGTVASGAGHGAYCVGCCAGIMLALFVLGVMSLFWMAVAGVAILGEKSLPAGEALASAVALALVALGCWVAVAHGSLPGLHQPGQMHVEMRR